MCRKRWSEGQGLSLCVVKKYVMEEYDEATAPGSHLGRSRTQTGGKRNSRLEKHKKDHRGLYGVSVLMEQGYYVR